MCLPQDDRSGHPSFAASFDRARKACGSGDGCATSMAVSIAWASAGKALGARGSTGDGWKGMPVSRNGCRCGYCMRVPLICSRGHQRNGGVCLIGVAFIRCEGIDGTGNNGGGPTNNVTPRCARVIVVRPESLNDHWSTPVKTSRRPGRPISIAGKSILRRQPASSGFRSAWGTSRCTFVLAGTGIVRFRKRSHAVGIRTKNAVSDRSGRSERTSISALTVGSRRRRRGASRNG